jgi:hypothetical protein
MPPVPLKIMPFPFRLPNRWPVEASGEKGEALHGAACAYDFDSHVFVRHAPPRKIFSVEWIHDNSASALRDAIASRGKDPEFYFSDVSPASVYDLARRYGWMN